MGSSSSSGPWAIETFVVLLIPGSDHGRGLALPRHILDGAIDREVELVGRSRANLALVEIGGREEATAARDEAHLPLGGGAGDRDVDDVEQVLGTTPMLELERVRRGALRVDPDDRAHRAIRNVLRIAVLTPRFLEPVARFVVLDDDALATPGGGVGGLGAVDDGRDRAALRAELLADLDANLVEHQPSSSWQTMAAVRWSA